MATQTDLSRNGNVPVEDDYGVPGEPSWLETDWRQHLRSAEILGTRANYVEVGSGPPIVFVHGLSGCWQNWLENIPYFAQTHRVIAVDLPGFGQSEMPSDRLTIQNYGRFLDELLDRLGIDSACVVGNSMGGFVSAELAIAHPSRVERLVLVSAAGVHKLPSKATPSQVVRASGWTQPVVNATLKRMEFLVRRARGRRIMLGMVARYPEKLTPQVCLEILAGANKPGFADALNTTLTYDFKPRLTEIEVPTLIVWGRNDMVVPVGAAHIYERLLVNAPSKKVILDHTGHVTMLERPQTFNRLVDEFVSQPLAVN